MNNKGKKIGLIFGLIILICLSFILSLVWENRIALRYLVENYFLGTYATSLSPEELTQKRTLQIGRVKFVVPPKWMILKSFDGKSEVTFDLNLPELDGSIDIFVRTSKTDNKVNSLDQQDVISAINDYMSGISTLANKDARTGTVGKSINGIEWLIVQATDEVSIGKRHTGIYYSVIHGDLVGVYFFSIADSPEPIMHAVEELIQTFRINAP